MLLGSIRQQSIDTQATTSPLTDGEVLTSTFEVNDRYLMGREGRQNWQPWG